VTFSDESVATLGYAEMQLLPEPLYTLSTDSIHMLCVKVTSKQKQIDKRTTLVMNNRLNLKLKMT
jgi:hypothetical protein